MPRHHESVVEAQFGPRAQAYVESAVHAQGQDLDALDGIVRALRPAHALDLGAGGGHVSYVMARHTTQVTAVDLLPDMVAVVAATARDKGLSNIRAIEAAAERLPFADASFDFLASRFSAHHWRDWNGGLRQARRVLKSGSPAVFIDVCSPGVALFDTHLQAVELLRDTSHLRDYSISEWCAALTRCGFALVTCRSWQLRMDFPVWTARMQTPADNMRAIRALQEAASDETKKHFAIEDDGSFMVDVVMVETLAA
ncbi:MAG: class I SAM-dependent methyltransferase [Betaproteobacteria bacterium]|nr:class I SAM-dependent methyltransferase [Betaproteobacteria bacterium]